MRAAGEIFCPRPKRSVAPRPQTSTLGAGYVLQPCPLPTTSKKDGVNSPHRRPRLTVARRSFRCLVSCSWNVNLGEAARIWTGGCIIRAGFLNRIKQAYETNPKLPSLLVDPTFAKDVIDRQRAWRRVVSLCVATGIACPSMSASLAYFDQYRRARLPANLVQAQRDYFGAHTYERVDKPRGEAYHCIWTDDHKMETGQ